MNYIKETQIADILKNALREDIGSQDITTNSIIPKSKQINAILLAKENFVICGIAIAGQLFRLRNRKVKFKPFVKDGQRVKKGQPLARLSGRARDILTAERVALNFLCLLSGIATKTHAYVKAVRPYRVKIMDTRKTLPGLRILQKYAVRIGGGYNHRMQLDEMIMVKDNHLKVMGSCLKLPKLKNGYSIEIEVKTLKEFKEILKLRPQIIMLDNMKFKDMKKAVLLKKQLSAIGQPLSTKLEASGGITLKNIRKIASCGVGRISVGSLTHSFKSPDISLEVV